MAPPIQPCSTIYSTCSSLNISCYVYNDAGRTDPYFNQIFSDGTYCYTTTATGMIDSKVSCASYVTRYICDPIFGCIYDLTGPYTSLAQCESDCEFTPY